MMIFFIVAAAVFIISIIQRAVVTAPFSYVLMVLFLLVPSFGLYFLWFRCPVRITIDEANTVTFYTKGNAVSMPITDIYKIHTFGSVWLQHAKGKYAFTATSINAPLRDFIQEVALRNPNIFFE